MAIYDVTAVAEALGVDPKQLDNVLSRNELEGVERKARGVTRRVSSDAAVTIHLAFELAAALRMPFGAALRVSASLQRSPNQRVVVGKFATLQADLAALRAATIAQLDSAVEIVGRRRRGRPPRAATGSNRPSGAQA